MKYEINATTGDILVREMTDEELLQEFLNQEKINLVEQERLINESFEAAAKESARAKLAALGLTEEEVAALIK